MKKSKLQTILSVLCVFWLIVFLWISAVYSKALKYALEPHKPNYTSGTTETWITVDKTKYVPDYQNSETFTPDKFIGFARDFYSSFKYQNTIPGYGVYTAAEDDNVLLVYSIYGTETVFIPEEK